MDNWLTEDLENEICEVFGSRYKRKLNKNEIREIAENLVEGLEIVIKQSLQNEYEKQLPN